MSKPEGLYLSVDYRLSDSATGEFIDDSAVKYLSVHYLGDVRAMLAFTGIAELGDATPVGTWLRETLRGRDEPFDASMAHLHERLRRDFAKYRQHLIVVVIVMDANGRRGFGGFTNEKASGYISRDFGYRMEELPGPRGFASGSPAARAEGDGQLDAIKEQLLVRPRHPRDHMNLLAAANRRVAEADRRRAAVKRKSNVIGTVSPYCQVAFMPATGEEYQPESRIYTQPGEEHSAPFVLPLVVHGIDTTFMSNGALEALRTRTPRVVDIEEAKRSVDRRP